MALTAHFSIRIIIITSGNDIQPSTVVSDQCYANHYANIEITGHRALYSKSIAGRGVARLISWLGTAELVDCFNKSVSDCYIRVYRFFIFIGRVQPTFGWAYFLLHP